MLRKGLQFGAMKSGSGRMLALALALAMALGTLASCAPVRADRETLRVALGSDPGIIDPATGYNVPAWSVEKLLFDSLVDYDDQGRIVPDLAATWSVRPDRLVFRLRRHIRFSDGERCTAIDVLASMDRLLNPRTRCPVPRFYSAIAGADAVIAGKATHIAGLSAPDPHTVVIRLTRPDPFLLQVLAMPFCSVLPEGRLAPRHPIGTGPFKLTRWIRGQRMIFDRTGEACSDGPLCAGASLRNRVPDADCSDGPLCAGASLRNRVPDAASRGPRRIEFLLGLTEMVEALKFERGELDLLGVHRAIDGPDFVRLMSDPKWKHRFVSAPELATYYVGMNTQIPPFDDVRVRRAVSLAIDRQRLVQLLNGRAVAARGFLPPPLQAETGPRTPPPLLRNIPEAKALLAQAGHPTGIDATYYCSNSATSVKLATAIQQDLADAGIRLTLEPLSFPTFLTAVGRKGAVPIFQGDWVADYPDPSNFLVPLFSAANIANVNSRNTTFFDDPRYESLLAQAAAQPIASRRNALYGLAERELMAQMPVAPLFYPVTFELAQPWVFGYRLHPIWPLDYWDLCLGAPCRPHPQNPPRQPRRAEP